jgi:signal transduction histidine kinase
LVGEHAWVYSTGEVSGRLRVLGTWIVFLSWQHELEVANAELMELDRLKSDFLSNVSHELRTPLTAIRSFTEIMLDPDSDLGRDERQEFLQIVASQADPFHP